MAIGILLRYTSGSVAEGEDVPDPPPEGEPPSRGSEEEEQEEPDFPSLGFMIAGLSGGAPHAELWTVEVNTKGECIGPTCVYDQNARGVVAYRGMPEALDRLLYGWSDQAWERMLAAGVSGNVVGQILMSYTDLAHPAMPIQDAIDLVRYLADVTAGFVRFKAGPPTVAAPIDIAAITRHQGFRWVQRKHYWSGDLNVGLEDK